MKNNIEENSLKSKELYCVSIIKSCNKEVIIK